MAILLNGIDQGVNCGLSSPLLSSAGSVFMYMEVTAARVADEVYLGLGMRYEGGRNCWNRQRRDIPGASKQWFHDIVAGE